MFGEPGIQLDPGGYSSSAPGSSGPESVPEIQSSQRVSPSGAPSVPRFVAPPAAPHYLNVPEVRPLVPPPMAPEMPAQFTLT
ncbi:hypothetical protein Bca101_067980 [Brassica carinata]